MITVAVYGVHCPASWRIIASLKTHNLQTLIKFKLSHNVVYQFLMGSICGAQPILTWPQHFAENVFNSEQVISRYLGNYAKNY